LAICAVSNYSENDFRLSEPARLEAFVHCMIRRKPTGSASGSDDRGAETGTEHRADRPNAVPRIAGHEADDKKALTTSAQQAASRERMSPIESSAFWY
jgi:hypothetical protein